MDVFLSFAVFVLLFLIPNDPHIKVMLILNQLRVIINKMKSNKNKNK